MMKRELGCRHLGYRPGAQDIRMQCANARRPQQDLTHLMRMRNLYAYMNHQTKELPCEPH